MMRNKRLLLKLVGKTRKISLEKYLFFALLILCLTVVAFLLYFSDKKFRISENEFGEVKYAKISSPEFTDDMLDVNFEACFFSNTSYFAHSGSADFNNGENIYSYNRKIPRDLINILLQFADISHQLRMETVLLEPSLLFCILSPKLKDLLLRRDFTVESEPSERMLTMGIFEKDAVILEKEDVKNKLLEFGFQIERIDSPILSWMKSEIYQNKSVFINHVFLEKFEWILHLVVFHQRHNYLWHSALLSQDDPRSSTKEAFLFTAAFENFTPVSLGFKVPSLEKIHIPTNPASFLNQIASSRFLECNETIVNLFRQQPVSNLSTHHEYSSHSPKEFNQRLLITIEELKLKLQPMLMSFWIWSGTLLGLHRQCDVIPYTSDVDFATWETNREDIDNLIEVFKQNEHLRMTEKLGLVEEGLEIKFKCHGLSVDLFFVYRQENGTWYAGHSPKNGYYFKYHHPTFSLCSAELLGHKVNVPCESEDVISAEYGSNWMQPVSSWSYEHSVHNRGPNIYWKKNLLGKVHIYF